MSRKVPFSRLARFTGDAGRDLALLEGNVAAKMRADDVQEWGPLQVVQNVASTYSAKAWDVVECNPTTTDGITVVLPDPSKNVGAWVGVKNASDFTYPIIVIAQSGALIDSDALHSMRMIRAFQWFYSNGQKWNRGPSHQEFAPVLVSGHTADANTIALWQGDPPDNGGSGLVDSSGHGLTLTLGAGNARYATLGYGREGFLCDGTNFWKRTVNDPSLNIVGDMTIEALIRPLVQPAGLGSVANGMTIVNYGAVGETGGNDNVLWSLSIGNGNVSGPSPTNMYGSSTFWETGAGVNSGIDDYKLSPLNIVQHVALVRSNGGSTYTFYVDGFQQSITTGQPVGTVGGAPLQTVTIGADHNTLQFFKGIIGSIKISNVARSPEYIYNDAARCLGALHRGVVTSV